MAWPLCSLALPRCGSTFEDDACFSEHNWPASSRLANHFPDLLSGSGSHCEPSSVQDTDATWLAAQAVAVLTELLALMWLVHWQLSSWGLRPNCHHDSSSSGWAGRHIQHATLPPSLSLRPVASLMTASTLALQHIPFRALERITAAHN